MPTENGPQTPPTPMEAARDSMVQNVKDEAKNRLQRKLYNLARPYLPETLRRRVERHFSKMLFSLVFGCVFFGVFGVVIVAVIGVVGLAALGFLS